MVSNGICGIQFLFTGVPMPTCDHTYHGTGVISHHFLQGFHVGITIATVVESQRPVRGHVGSTDDLLILLHDPLRVGAQEEVEIQDPSDGAVEETVRAEDDIYPIAVSEEDSVGQTGRSHLQVEWVRAVCMCQQRCVSRKKQTIEHNTTPSRATLFLGTNCPIAAIESSISPKKQHFL